MWPLFISLIGLRFVWTLLPQSGYIHPDEFFQTVEVVAGDTFNISIVRTWEFQSEFPLRSMVVPKLLFSPAFQLLLKTCQVFPRVPITGYSILCTTRTVMTLLSLWMDFSVHKIGSYIGIESMRTSLLLASSYVMLTFQTHTFSNSLEALLLITLIWLIFRDVRKSTFISEKGCECSAKQKEFLKAKEKKYLDTVESDDKDGADDTMKQLHMCGYDLRKRRLNSESDNVKTGSNQDSAHSNKFSAEKIRRVAARDSDHSNSSKSSKEPYSMVYWTCILLAVVNVAGIFNRPTFVAFSLWPFLWWLYYSFSSAVLTFKRLTVFVVMSLWITSAFIIVDTSYYHNLPISQMFKNTSLIQNDTSKESVVFTPLNFVLYNLNTDNLKAHGHHPFYLHCLVNVPLLFGPMAWFVGKSIYSMKRPRTADIDTVDAHNENCLVSHYMRENRFKNYILLQGAILVPLLILSYIPHQEPRFLVPLLPLFVLLTSLQCKKFAPCFIFLFIIFNVILSILFGLFHQGGIIPCLFKMEEISRAKVDSKFYFIFSHTYMPPKYVLLSKEDNVDLIDLKGDSIGSMFDMVVKLKDHENSVETSLNQFRKLFIAIPGTLMQDFEQVFKGNANFSVVEKFFPHLSLEDPPDLSKYSSITKLLNDMSLFLFEIA